MAKFIKVPSLEETRKTVYNAGVETTKEYLDRDKVKKITPNIELKIAPFMMPFVPVIFVSADVDGLIIACNYAKSRSNPGGKFVITLAADDEKFKHLGQESAILGGLWDIMGVSLRDIFKPMSYAELKVDGYNVMVGYLSSFRKQTTSGTKTYIAEFEELGNLLHKNILDVFTIEVGSEIFKFNDPTKAWSGLQGLKGIPVHTAIKTYLDGYKNSSLNIGLKGFPTNYWRSSEGFPMAFRLVAEPPPLGAISPTSLLASITADVDFLRTIKGTSFWDFLKSLSSETFIELFTESGGRTMVVGRQFQRAGIIQGSTLAATQKAATATGVPIPGTNIAILAPGFSYIVLRTLPYDNPMIGGSGWAKVLYPFTLGVFDLILGGDFVIIDDTDIIQKDLGTSEKQQFTVFRANETAHGASGDGIKYVSRPYISGGPLNPLSPGGIRTFGMRVMDGSINFNSIEWKGVSGQVAEGKGSKFGIPFLKQSVHSLSTLLGSWHRNASKFMEGTITTRPFPYARPGMMLLYLPSLTGAKIDDPREIGMYYIDNIQYNYQYGKNPTTTFTVIRGTPMPIPFTGSGLPNLIHLLQDWEILPTGLNLVDGET